MQRDVWITLDAANYAAARAAMMGGRADGGRVLPHERSEHGRENITVSRLQWPNYTRNLCR